MDATYEFVDYGEVIDPRPATIALDVGMKTVPGVIDHHHPDAEPECAASLVALHPNLVLDHLGPEPPPSLHFITHRMPDFDAIASIALALALLDRRAVDGDMRALADYTKLADSAALPKTIDLAATPHAVLRALFTTVKGTPTEVNQVRVREGLRLMGRLLAAAGSGQSILENEALFRGIDRYERAVDRCRSDYLSYLEDGERGERVRLCLPLVSGDGCRDVDGILIRNPRSFLFKDWARRDRDAPLGRGFEFLMAGFGSDRYILGVDHFSGVSLRGLGPRLDARESAARASRGLPPGERWYDGNAPFFAYRIVDTPRGGTALAYDDVVAELKAFGTPA